MNYKICDLCEVTSSRRIFAREYTTCGVPFFRSQEVIESSLRGHAEPTIFISENRYNQIIQSKLPVPKKGDILLSAIGANRGYPWHVDIDHFYFKDGNVIWLRNFTENCNSSYICYYLGRETIITSMQRASEHSAQGALTIDLIKSIEIELPDLIVQQHIVNTIGSVDDLIENLNKQNEKLMSVGLTLINSINDVSEHKKLLSICEL
ncbi:MAG: restriction endonuclease subunit S, partial [Bacilli bacterium]|nr:restriction endonuclease subunit S [Bacilli bacterium]